MAESFGLDGPARMPGGDGARAVPRVEQTGAPAQRTADHRGWVREVRGALEEAGPLLDALAGAAPLDAQALSEARAEIAAALARADALESGLERGGASAAGFAIPVAPGASADAVAAAQALARLIAANARPAIRGQARLRADAVMTVIGPDAA